MGVMEETGGGLQVMLDEVPGEVVLFPQRGCEWAARQHRSVRSRTCTSRTRQPVER